MANFQFFDLGRAYADAENIRASRQNQELRGLQIEAVKQQLEQAGQPKKLSPEQYLQNKKALVSLLQQAKGDRGNLRGYLEFAERNDWVVPGVASRVAGLPEDEQIAGLDRLIADLSDPEKPGREQGEKFGSVNPGDFTPESLAAYAKTVDPTTGRGDYSLLKRQYAPQQAWVGLVGNVPTAVPRVGGGVGAPQPLSTLPDEVRGAGAVAGGKKAAEDETQRLSGFVDDGVSAADASAVVRRGIDLLGEVSTGGLNVVKLKAANLFGVTGADEGELSANLGKAVLSQLRSTFGAQFTEREGKTLMEIEAGFGKSTAANRRLLQQALTLMERKARRGLDAAEKLGDEFSASEIRAALGLDLSPGSRPAEKKPDAPDPLGLRK